MLAAAGVPSLGPHTGITVSRGCGCRHQQAGAVLKLEGHAGKCHQPVRTGVGFNQQWIEPLSFFS